MSIHWDDLRFFLAVQRAGTLKAAGAELRTDPTTVGRRLGALEAELRTRLFDRKPEGFVPTAAGLRLLTFAERIAEQVHEVEHRVAGDEQKLEGSVRLTATEMLATRFLAPHLASFAALYPEINLVIDCSSEVVSLVRRETDIALRLSRPREDALVGRRLAEIELGLYASRSYLEASQDGAEEGELRGHKLLAFADTPAFARENRWLVERAEGATIVMRSNSVSTLYATCAGGLGVALLPCLVADLDARLRRFSAERGPEPRSIWLIVHRDLSRTARVRAVLDFLARILRPGSKVPDFDTLL